MQTPAYILPEPEVFQEQYALHFSEDKFPLVLGKWQGRALRRYIPALRTPHQRDVVTDRWNMTSDDLWTLCQSLAYLATIGTEVSGQADSLLDNILRKMGVPA